MTTGQAMEILHDLARERDAGWADGVARTARPAGLTPACGPG